MGARTVVMSVAMSMVVRMIVALVVARPFRIVSVGRHRYNSNWTSSARTVWIRSDATETCMVRGIGSAPGKLRRSIIFARKYLAVGCHELAGYNSIDSPLRAAYHENSLLNPLSGGVLSGKLISAQP